jgi:hypothetical protein
MQSHLHCAEQVVIQGWTENVLVDNQENIYRCKPRAADKIRSDLVSPSGSQLVTVTSLSKSLNTKTSFPQTHQSACESRYDLFPS